MSARPSPVHGVLLALHGQGVLLTGPPAVGKSALALALLERGHRLVADDAPLLWRDRETLYGRCPAPLQGFLQVRGLGVLNVERLFGDATVAGAQRIDWLVALQPAPRPPAGPAGDGDRLLHGDWQTADLLGVALPRLPVYCGAGALPDPALRIDCAARDRALRADGYSAGDDIARRQRRLRESAPCG